MIITTTIKLQIQFQKNLFIILVKFINFLLYKIYMYKYINKRMSI
jgi:hypothetical protein